MVKDIICKDLSYKIIGCAFNVYNQIGFGHKEEYYQKAFAVALRSERIDFTREKVVPLKFENELVGKYKLDFVVDDKIVVELKVLTHFRRLHLKQILSYLNCTNLKLAIIIFFTQEGIKYRRIVNPKYSF